MRSPEPMRRGMRWSATFACILMLSACQTSTPAIEQPKPPPKATLCAVVKPIIFSRLHDTAETIEQIKVFNARYDELCPS